MENDLFAVHRVIRHWMSGRNCIDQMRPWLDVWPIHPTSFYLSELWGSLGPVSVRAAVSSVSFGRGRYGVVSASENTHWLLFGDRNRRPFPRVTTTGLSLGSLRIACARGEALVACNVRCGLWARHVVKNVHMHVVLRQIIDTPKVRIRSRRQPMLWPWRHGGQRFSVCLSRVMRAL